MFEVSLGNRSELWVEYAYRYATGNAGCVGIIVGVQPIERSEPLSSCLAVVRVEESDSERTGCTGAFSELVSSAPSNSGLEPTPLIDPGDMSIPILLAARAWI